MAVDSIQNHSAFGSMVNGAVLGGGLGVAAKYIQPLTPQEYKDPEYIKGLESIREQYSKYNAETKRFVETMNSKPVKTLAEDTFVKMFNDVKDGDVLDYTKMKTVYNELKNSNAAEARSFNQIMNEFIHTVDSATANTIKVYNRMVKGIRPTGIFVAIGAAIGTLTGLLLYATKTDIKKVS